VGEMKKENLFFTIFYFGAVFTALVLEFSNVNSVVGIGIVCFLLIWVVFYLFQINMSLKKIVFYLFQINVNLKKNKR
jgi:hypothetical protein